MNQASQTQPNPILFYSFSPFILGFSSVHVSFFKFLGYVETMGIECDLLFQKPKNKWVWNMIISGMFVICYLYTFNAKARP